MSPLVNPNAIEQAINKAIDFLYQNQLPYGEFKTYASPNENMTEGIIDSSPYVTTFVLYSLSFWTSPKITEMTTKGINFLLSEMEGPGLWRYWSSHHESHNMLPPDIDDTCCISFTLKMNNCVFPANKDIILANKNDEGIFYTWLLARPNSPIEISMQLKPLIKPEAFVYITFGGVADNIDCAVNANVLLYLGENDQTQDVIRYLITVINNQSEEESSLYLPNPLVVYYLISRAYFNNVSTLIATQEPIITRIKAKQYPQGHWGSDLETTLAICTMLNFNYNGPEIEQGIQYLLATQQIDGAWARFPMFLGPAPYYGSEELTTSFAVEAFARYLKLHG